MKTIAQLRETLNGRLPLAFGVGGALGTRLYTDRDTERLIEAARGAGVSVFDTGPSYGAGLAETRLGQVIGNDPDAFIMSKAGLYASGLLKRTRDFSPETLTESVHGSLKRLQRDTIDLLWLHGPHATELTDDVLQALEALASDGKVAAFGVAARDYSALDGMPDGICAALMAPANPSATPRPPEMQAHVFFGIECLAGVRSKTGRCFNRNRLWQAARALIRNDAVEPPSRTAQEAFTYAFQEADCDLVVSSSTQAARIQESSSNCAAFTIH